MVIKGLCVLCALAVVGCSRPITPPAHIPAERVATWQELVHLLTTDSHADLTLHLVADLIATSPEPPGRMTGQIVVRIPRVCIDGGGHTIDLRGLSGGTVGGWLRFDGVRRFEMQRLTILGSNKLRGTALWIVGDGKAGSSAILRDVTFRDLPAAQGVYCARVAGVLIQGCEFDNVGTTRPIIDGHEERPHAVYLTSGECTLRDCVFRGRAGGGHYAVLIRNYHTIYPERCPLPVAKVLVEGCRFIDAESGISISADRPEGAVRVVGNRFSGAPGNCITIHRDMVNAPDVTITGNTYGPEARFTVINVRSGDLEWWKSLGFD